MTDQSISIELWRKRKHEFAKVIVPYLMYMARSGFPAVLALVGILAALQYVDLIQNVPPDLPIAWIGAIILTPLVCYSPFRSYLKEADVIFLMPMEHKLKSYLKMAHIRSFRNSSGLLLSVLLIFWPLYRQSDGYIGIWIAVILVLVKLINANFAWQERRMAWDQHRTIIRLLRWLLMFVVVLGWLMRVSILTTAIVTISVVALLFTLYRSFKKQGFPWRRLIEEEKLSLRRIYSFFSWFIDIQGEAPNVKQRRYLGWLIRLVPYRKSATFIYLHVITFVRTEIGGICIRLVLLGALVNYMIADNDGMMGWGAVISFVLFGLIVSLQLSTLRKAHRHAIWKDIFPLSVHLQQRQLIAVDQILLYIMLAILLVGTFPMWNIGYATQLILMLIFLLAYPMLRAKRLQTVLRKEEELD